MAIIDDGLRIETAVAPDVARVRPLVDKRDRRTKTFPVYRELSSKLLKPENPVDKRRVHPDLTVAHVLSVCAGYSYSDAGTVAMMMTRMGLEQCRCVSIGMAVDAMFIVSTAYLVQSADGKVVILCYRGTEPSNIISWLTDADVHPEKVQFEVHGRQLDLHAGFYRNVRATRFKVGEVLDLALRGRAITDYPGGNGSSHVDQMEVLYVTGHSLGGAMAAIMGLMLQAEQPYRRYFRDRLHAVYTYGQPMVGVGALADAWSGEGRGGPEMVRYVYQNDPVPHVPPRDTGPFRHFGREYRYYGGTWHRSKAPVAQMSNWLGIPWSIAAAVLRHFPLGRVLPAPYQLYDHGAQHYIVALTPPGVTTEYGDHNYVTGSGMGDRVPRTGMRYVAGSK